MIIYVFGGTSSPSCSNCALKELQLIEKTLQNNFYVDDLLKYVDDEDEAMKLVKEVNVMCA